MTEQKIKLKEKPPKEKEIKVEVKLPKNTPIASSLYRRTSPDKESQTISQRKIRESAASQNLSSD